MNIFVAKLNFSTDDDGLREVFEKFGTVDTASIIKDRETGRSKGFGFVEMANAAEAKNAIAALDNTELDGRTIVVKEAEDRENRAPRSGGGGGDRKFGNNNRGGGGGGYGGGHGGGGGYGGGGDRQRRDNNNWGGR